MLNNILKTLSENGIKVDAEQLEEKVIIVDENGNEMSLRTYIKEIMIEVLENE